MNPLIDYEKARFKARAKTQREKADNPDLYINCFAGFWE